jgi:hypothetical protein
MDTTKVVLTLRGERSTIRYAHALELSYKSRFDGGFVHTFGIAGFGRWRAAGIG